MTDPRGWEALTQAEGDADVRAIVRRFCERLVNEPQSDDVRWAQATLDGHAYTVLRALRELESALAVAERERDEAREALREIADCAVGWTRPMTDRERLANITRLVGAALAGGPQT